MQNLECKMQKDTSSVAQSHRLAEARSQNGSDVINVIHDRSAATLPQGEGSVGGSDMVAVIRCRDCKHGQQFGGYGVLCEYGLEELRSMDHFCAWGEMRSFEPEDNEEE